MRPSSLNTGSLPALKQILLFVRPSDEQRALYADSLARYEEWRAQADGKDKMSGSSQKLAELAGIVGGIGKMAQDAIGERESIEMVSKHAIVLHMLAHLRTTRATKRVLIISNYVKSLERLRTTIESKGWLTTTLYGDNSAAQRKMTVDKFNALLEGDSTVFLLSSKAGGCGLNIVGACILIMLDVDWNPANDDQALARIWRPGQLNACVTYRFISSGTMEEAKFGRQLRKRALARDLFEDGTVMASPPRACTNLWHFSPFGECETHRVMQCAKCTSPSSQQSDDAHEQDPATWSHHEGTTDLPDDLACRADEALRKDTSCYGARVEFSMSFQCPPQADAPAAGTRNVLPQQAVQRRRRMAVLHCGSVAKGPPAAAPDFMKDRAESSAGGPGGAFPKPDTQRKRGAACLHREGVAEETSAAADHEAAPHPSLAPGCLHAVQSSPVQSVVPVPAWSRSHGHYLRFHCRVRLAS